MGLKALVGCGDRIALLAAPVLAVGIPLNIAHPSLFQVGGPPPALRWISLLLLIPGVSVWIWSAALILAKVPRNKLITEGPYALVRHPLYTAVGLLVLPWAGFLLDTWLGAAAGGAVYLGCRLFAPREEAVLERAFGGEWEEYRKKVLLPWL